MKLLISTATAAAKDKAAKDKAFKEEVAKLIAERVSYEKKIKAIHKKIGTLEAKHYKRKK